MPTATAQVTVPTLAARPFDLRRVVDSPRRVLRAGIGSPLQVLADSRGCMVASVASAGMSGRIVLCRFAPALGLIATSYDRAPATAVEATGDGLLLLQLRLEGDAIFGHDEHARGCRASLSYFPPASRLAWTLPHGGPWRSLALAGSPAALEKRWGLGKAALRAIGPVPRRPPRGDPAVHRPWTVTRESLEVLRSIIACRHEGDLLRSYCEARAHQLLCEFLAAGPLQAKEPPRRKRIEELVRRARETLVSDPSRPHTLESLAREHGLSRRLLAEGFRSQFGETMYGCLQRERLRRAWTLLDRSGEKVATVAARVGYRDSASFTRAFRVHFGLTPRQVASGLARQAGSPLGPAEGVKAARVSVG